MLIVEVAGSTLDDDRRIRTVLYALPGALPDVTLVARDVLG